MASKKTPVISARKAPRQKRSEQLVADILTAAARVLAKQGARRFTTARVAEAAGISVGSLYQYFPNKESILFRLQSNEWRDTSQMLDRILTDAALAPQARLREAVRAFFRSECEEAQLRVALGDAAPLYRDAPEAKARWGVGQKRIQQFIETAFPRIRGERRSLAAHVLTLTMGAVGKKLSEQGRSMQEVDTMAFAVSDMFRAYLESE